MDINKILAQAVPGARCAEGAALPTLVLPCNELRQAASALKAAGFDYLISLTGVDDGTNLGTVYHLSSSLDKKALVVLKTSTSDRTNPVLPTVSDIWTSANLYEREVYDFYGVRFINHPDMRRLFLRNDFKGFPFRKDFNEVNDVPTSNVTPDDLETVPSISLDSEGHVVEKEASLFGKNDYVVNFGPQHPATHGVLHLRIKLDGETVEKVDPNFGYIHRGIEKLGEGFTYAQMLPYTERLDYLSGSINRHALCLCVEKAAGIEVPERAQCVRVIFDELTRIASHLLGWGCMAMDMGAITAFIYGMRDREKIMDVFEETAGGRLMPSYSVIGGLVRDLHPNFKSRVKEFIPYMRKMLDEYHTLFTGNPIATGRMHDVGWLDRATAIDLGVTGPSGRASGWSNDVRKIAPYAAYDRVNFHEVVRNADSGRGDTFDRYIIRLDEILESLNIIEQLVDNIPDDGFRAKVPPIVKLPAGEYFQRVENARGDFDVYIASDGGKTPTRIKFRSPCLTLISALDPICRGQKIADLIAIGASLDYVIPCADR